MNAPLRAFLKSLYGTVVPLFYRKVEITGQEHIPAEGPIMICANHSNAFLDPLLMGVPFPRHVWYLARGDVFKGPAVNRILHALGILPIYRKQEGADNLEKNAEVFETCYRFLGKGGVIGIFPEGNAERESHLRPLKKGAARILLGACETGNVKSALYVVPAGINYEFPDHFYSRLHLRYGRPIEVSDYLEPGAINTPRNVNRLSKAIHEALSEVHIHIDDKFSQRAFYFLVNQFEQQFETEKLEGDAYFNAMQCWAKEWNRKTADRDTGLSHYLHFEHVLHGIHKQHRILPSVMLHAMNGGGAVHKFPGAFTVIAGVLFGLPGLIFNVVPFRLPYLLARKKVKKPEFFNSVNVVSAGVIFLLWYLLAYQLLGLFFEPAWLRFMLLSGFWFSGLLAIRLHHAFRRFESIVRWKRFCRAHRGRVEELTLMAKDIQAWAKNFVSDARNADNLEGKKVEKS